MACHFQFKRMCGAALGLKKAHIKRYLLFYKPAFGLQKKLYSATSVVSPNYETIYDSWRSTAIEDFNGDHSYSQLFTKSMRLKSNLDSILGSGEQRHIVTLLNSDVSYVIAQWATWGSGHVAVPVLPSYPIQQIEYLLKDSKSSLVITTKEHSQKLGSILAGHEVLVLEDDFLLPVSSPSKEEIKEESLCYEFCQSQRGTNKQGDKSSKALIIYTSGTTGPPKGVVLTHNNLITSINSIAKSWKMTSSDISLQSLPLNHIHGIVYALMSPLYVGARVVMELKFDAGKVWNRFINSDVPSDSRVNVFMAVPTMYVKLIEHYEKEFSNNPSMKEHIKNFCQANIRVMVSGSASLPTAVIEKWKEITGHSIMERYGMTEIGLALSNPLEEERKPGFVGQPLDKVKVRIAEFSPNRDSVKVLCEGDDTRTITAEGYNGESGELLIKGDNVFSHYWEKEEETKKNFTEDGWFMTGDTAAYIDGYYKILGRTSVDIIKSGGYKISSLDIEKCLLTHPSIAEVAVVGIPDSTWGEKVAALIVWKGATPFDLQELRTWAKELLPRHQVPSEVKLVSDQLPKNHLGKVNKKQLIRDNFGPSS